MSLKPAVKLLTSSRIPTDKVRSSFTLSNFVNDLNGAQTALLALTIQLTQDNSPKLIVEDPKGDR